MDPYLPIDDVLPKLTEALRNGRSAVLTAEPGAGKTTRVPPALLHESWMENQRVLLVEPRRLAARSAARFMADRMGEKIGETVGYRVRMDSRIGPGTRIVAVTEGVLIRLLQDDPFLSGFGIVIFDEFHERSLQTDLGLALCLQCRAVFREDLRLLPMSATMAAEPAARLLGGAPVIASAGRAYPVETRHCGRPGREERIEAAMARTIVRALAEEPGDVLAFLPGAGEIRRTAERLGGLLAAGAGLGPVAIAPLYANLPLEEQDAAIAAGVSGMPGAAPGARKVVLATSIAETSLTVEGVRIVIDSGLARVPRFSPRTGMTRLETVQVSLDSADQRRGRAGRREPGVCYRLWSEAEEVRFAPGRTPEILEADLAGLALELAAWGAASPDELDWLDPPPPAAWQQARELLIGLAALGPDGAITPHGRRMAALGLHPRLAHMVLEGAALGLERTACELAALLQERDVLRPSGGAAESGAGRGPYRPAMPEADLRRRLEALRQAGGGRQTAAGRGRALAGWEADPALCRRIAAEADQLQRQLAALTGIAPAAGSHAGRAVAATTAAASEDMCGRLLALAYPDRVAQRRGDGRYLLAGGPGAAFPYPQALAASAWLAIAEVEAGGADSLIRLAAPLSEKDVRQAFGHLIHEERLVAWDPAAQSVQARVRERLGALVLKEGPLASPDEAEVAAALIQGIRREGLGMLPWTRAAEQLRDRLRFLHRLLPDWPAVEDADLLRDLPDWLAPCLCGMRSRSDLQRLQLHSLLEQRLTWPQRQQLPEWAPTHWTVPSGSRVPIDYSDPGAPFLAVRLQELFGLHESPRIGGGRIPLTFRLLSPAGRPVQVTRDLANFWRDTYFEVRKDLRGRYPKHYWPEDPFQAAATRRVRPNG